MNTHVRRVSRGWTPLAMLVILGSASPTQAAPLFTLPSGQDVSLGGGSHPRSVQVAGNNPAAPVTSDLGKFWFGLGGAGVGYELGDVNNLLDDIEALEDELDRADYTNADEATVEARFQSLLAKLNAEAFVKLYANAQPPLLPMGGALSGLGGAFTLSATAISGARVGFLGTDVDITDQAYDPNASNNATNNQTCSSSACELHTDLAGVGKAAAGGVISLGYSGGVHHRPDGSLFMGGRLNYYTLELSQGVIAIDDGDDTTDADDGVEDEFDRNRRRSSAVGLDLGVLWAAHNFRAGATLRNVNEPEFEYGALGADCVSKTGAARANCDRAVALAAQGRIDLNETYTMEQQIQLETAVYTSDRTWSLGLTYDADAVKDAVGDEYQWLAVNASFAPASWGWLVPGLRAGYRQNQAGSELDMVSVGLSLFRVVNLDVAASTDEVENDGDEVPRSAFASLSFELFF